MKISFKHFLSDVSTDGDIADELGDLRAKAKAIADQVTFLEEVLKDKGVTVAEGKRFRVTVSYGVETKRVDWHGVAEDLQVPAEVVERHTYVSVGDRVRVTAHKKGG